jgi:hypothetical protein
MVDEALKRLSPRLSSFYADSGRPSIPPERLLRAPLLQVLFSIRSERLLIEQLEYNLLFRWFVGLGIDDPIWAPTVFAKIRDRMLQGEVAEDFFGWMKTVGGIRKTRYRGTPQANPWDSPADRNRRSNRALDRVAALGRRSGVSPRSPSRVCS